MTQQEQDKYYQSYSTEYSKAERFAFRAFQDVINSQLKEVISAVLLRGIIATELDLTNLILEKPIAETFSAVFVRIGRQFRDFQNAQFDKQKNASGLIAGFFSEAFDRQMQDYALTVAGAHITSITETTRRQVKEVLAEAAQNRLSVRDAAKLIRKRLGGQFSRNRALLIARTETTSAANHGQYITAKNAGIDLEKLWLVRIDGRQRDWHADMKGKKVGLAEEFTVGWTKMLYPGDPKGGASNLCNCRCTCAYIPKESVPVSQSSSPSIGLIGQAIAELLRD